MDKTPIDGHVQTGEFELEKYDDKAYSFMLRNKNLTFSELEDTIQKSRLNFDNAIMIDVSFNKLDQIILKQFKYLTHLNLSNNQIASFNLSVMPSLIFLDLSSNRISSISAKDFILLGTLKCINLSLNFITSIPKDTFSHLIYLEKLDISFNKLRFKTVHDFYEWIEEIDRNNKLLSDVSLFKNVFSKDKRFITRYVDYIKNYLKSMKYVNNQKVQERDRAKAVQIITAMKEIEEKNINISTFDKFVVKFEAIMHNQFDFMEKFQNLLKDIYLYLIDPNQNKYTLGEEFDKFDKETVYVKRFIECCKIANENHAHFEQIIKDLLVKLAITKNGKWAFESLDLLFHLSNNNIKLTSEIEKMLIEGILMDSNIHPKINDGSESNFFVSHPMILKGIIIFCDSNYPEIIKFVFNDISEEYNLLYKEDRIVDYYFSRFDDPIEIKEISEEDYLLYNRICFLKTSMKALEKCFKRENIEYILPIKQENFKICLKFLFCFFNKEKDNIEKKKFLKYFIIISRLILNLFNRLDYNFMKSSISSIQGLAMQLNTIKNSIKKYYNNQSYLFPKEKDMIGHSKAEIVISQKTKQNILYNLKIKAYLYLMLLSKDETANFFKMDSEIRNYCLNFINIKFNETEYKTINDYFLNFDPVLLEVSIYTVWFIIKKNKYFTKDEKSYLYVIGTLIENVINLLKFLQEASLPFQMVSKTSTIYDTKNYLMIQRRNIYEFKYITSSYMESLIQSILNLLLSIIMLTSKQSVQEEIRNKLILLNDRLNDCGRDGLITGCLNISSNEIKKVVLKCFIHTDFNQISGEEISGLLNTIGELNYLEGDMEQIIGNLFIFLNKIFQASIERNLEKIVMNFKAVEIAFEIFSKNSDRRSQNKKEFDELQYLNIALIIFLVNCSNNPIMKKAFEKEQLVLNFQQIINNEFRYFDVLYYIPLEIEKTRVGNKVTNIMKLFKGEKYVYPYSFIGLRIFIHLADLLNNEPMEYFDLLNTDNFNKIIEEAKKKIKKDIIRKIKQEKLSWTELKEEMIKKKSKKLKYQLGFLFYKEENELKSELEIFSTNIIFFLDVLYGSEINTEAQKIMNKMKTEKIDNKFSKIDVNMQNNEENIKLDENRIVSDINSIHKDTSARDIREYSKYFMRTSDLNSKESKSENILHMYSYIKNDLIINDEFFTDENNIKRASSLETVDNLYIRGLIFSAFLRCLKAVLNSPYTHIRKKLLASLRLRENYIKLLTIIDTSKLINYSIGGKLLYIVRKIVLNISFDVNKDNLYDICLIIQITSFLTKKILLLLNSFDKTDMKYRVLIVKLVKLCLTLSKEIQYIYADNKIKKELIDNLLSKKLINILIGIIIEEMEHSSSSNKFSKNSIFRGKNLNMIIIEIIKFLAEYMSANKTNSYSLIEKFNTINIIDGHFIRKSFMIDLVGFSKIYKLKYRLKDILNIRVFMIGVCEVLFYKDIFSSVMFFIITDDKILFYKYNKGFLENSFDYEKKIEKDEDKTIYINNIYKIYLTSNPYRMFIKDIDKGDLTILLKRSYNVFSVCEFLLALNPRIHFSKEAKLFLTDEEKELEDNDDKNEPIEDIEEDKNKKFNENKQKENLQSERLDKEKAAIIKTITNENVHKNENNGNVGQSGKSDSIALNKNTYYFQEGNEKLRSVDQFKKGFYKEYIQKDLKGIDFMAVNIPGDKYDREVISAVNELKIEQEQLQNSKFNLEEEKRRKENISKLINLIESKSEKPKIETQITSPANLLKQLKIKMLKKQIYLVSLELNNFFDYFFSSDAILLNNPKLIYLKGYKMFIYRENVKKLKNVPLNDEYFDFGLLGMLADCYQIVGEYDLYNMDNVIFHKQPVIELVFGFKSIELKFYGDYAYTSFRDYLLKFIHTEKKMKQNV